jgi:hypothetical protein
LGIGSIVRADQEAVAIVTSITAEAAVSCVFRQIARHCHSGFWLGVLKNQIPEEGLARFCSRRPSLEQHIDNNTNADHERRANPGDQPDRRCLARSGSRSLTPKAEESHAATDAVTKESVHHLNVQQSDKRVGGEKANEGVGL